MTRSFVLAEHARLQPSLQPASTSMRVSLAFIKQRVNVWLRFGKPSREAVIDSWRRVAVFESGATCCRVKWMGNHFGTTFWQLMVLQAPYPAETKQRLAGVTPGVCLLLRAEGERQVKSVFEVIDSIESGGFDPCTVPETYWRTVGNRLAARQALPAYTTERHTAHLARSALQ